jgi:cupin fold WbuC family metalloprotein
MNSAVEWLSGRLLPKHLRSLATRGDGSKLHRFCFHEGIDSELHVMLVSIPPNISYPSHRHNDTDEWYLVLHGELMISIFESSCCVGEQILVRAMSTESIDDVTMGFLLKKGTWHMTTATDKGAIFLEVRRGPFDKSNTEYLIG